MSIGYIIKTILNSYPLLKMKIEDDDDYYYNNDE